MLEQGVYLFLRFFFMFGHLIPELPLVCTYLTEEDDTRPAYDFKVKRRYSTSPSKEFPTKVDRPHPNYKTLGSCPFILARLRKACRCGN